jgi:hypothetical protein
VGAELPDPLIAVLLDASGQPLPDTTVDFVVTQGNGSVFAPAVSSDALGQVGERWTLGTATGPQEVDVRSVDASGTTHTWAKFQATAVAGPPSSLAIASGNAQSALASTPLPAPVVVQVLDGFGNQAPNVAVTFTPDSQGTVQPGQTTTGSKGNASTVWTLGPGTGGQNLAIAVSSVPSADATANAYSWAEIPFAMTKYAGDQQNVLQYSFPPNPVQVMVTDRSGNPVDAAEIEFDLAGSRLATVFSGPDGIATCPSSSIQIPQVGAATITASVISGPGSIPVGVPQPPVPPVTFTFTVDPSNGAPDGTYNVTWNGVVQMQFTLSNGQVILFNIPDYCCTSFDSSTGAIGFEIDDVTPNLGTYRYIYSGTLTVDSNGHGTASGTMNYRHLTSNWSLPWTAARIE